MTNERWIRQQNHDKISWTKSKNFRYLIDDPSEDKKTKGTKKCIMKRKLKFENYRDWLEATNLENKMNCLEKI